MIEFFAKVWNRKSFTAAAFILASFTVTACENLGAGLDIVNETDSVLYSVSPIEPGGRWRYSTSDCSDADLTVTDKNGKAFAVLTERWCPGQTWIIEGKNKSRLVG